MTQDERLLYLIEYLLDEDRASFPKRIEIPSGTDEKKVLLRALFNTRQVKEADEEFLKIQDEYLRLEIERKGVTDVDELTPEEDGVYLWQGDITTLKCDAIVNAANSGLTGCWLANHTCIDNCIHTFAGVQLRLECARIVEKQGGAEATGGAKITAAYNLPCSFVIHTVGPIVRGGRLAKTHEAQLASCYLSCLDCAWQNGIKSIAFCCVSTGEFGFPNEPAARIAVRTVRNFRREHPQIKVIFNVFKDRDREIYQRVLGLSENL